MTQNEIFAQRLKNARVMKGYSMDELVAAMDNSLSKMAISKYEKCQLAPSSTVLISLSRLWDSRWIISFVLLPCRLNL